MHRVRVTWTGAPVVGPSVSTFYFEELATDAPITALKNFFTANILRHPTGIQWTIPSSGDILNETDGSLAGSWSFPGAGGVVASTGPSNFANGVGYRVQWRTNGIHNERRVIGSTFMVPMEATAFEGAGNIVAGTITAVQTAASAFVTACAGDLVIWSKPKDESTADGELNAVVSAIMPDKVSWLRSRRT